MQALLHQNLNTLLVFVFVLTRIGALVMTAPIFGSTAVPIRIRALLAVALSALVTPLYPAAPPRPQAVPDLLTLLGAEAILGAALGLGVAILFSGLQLTGQIIGQMAGMQLADAFDPTFNANVPIFSQLLFWIAMTVFLLVGGHRQVIAALLDSFVQMPPGEAAFSPHVSGAVMEAASLSFSLAIRSAAPVMTALLASLLVLGLIGRTLPQLNIFAVGFSMNSMVALGAMSLSLGAMIWVFQDQVEPWTEIIRETFERGY